MTKGRNWGSLTVGFALGLMAVSASWRLFNPPPVILQGTFAVTPQNEAGQSFAYEEGESQISASAVRAHTRKVNSAKGLVYLYATFNMSPRNPATSVDGSLPGVQIITLGQMAAGEFIPALRFGLQDGKGLPGDQGQLVPWVFDGQLDNFGGYARPSIPYDFKLRLDLPNTRMTVSVNGRGDDEWFLLAEDVRLMNPVSEINEVRVEQYPGAKGITNLRIGSRPWAPGESVRDDPQAKVNREVRPNAGFKFQSMRSLWRLPGRHVTISRDPKRWHGFPDVVYTRSGKLITTYCDGRSHGGGGKASLRYSADLGKTWSAEKLMVESNASCERLQRLKDGSLLYVGGEKLPTVEFRRSNDEGESWKTIGGFDVRSFGLKVHYSMSHVLEGSDGIWFIVGSDTYPLSAEAFDAKNRFSVRERLQVFHSKNEGKSWELLSLLDTFPSSGHAGSEAGILELPDGRLVIYARESRNDGYPGFRVFSSDRGKSWSEPEDLPLQVVGRVQANFLSDGRVLLTTRTGMGRRALWAWVEDPERNVGFQISGVHINDHSSKGLKHGVLHIDSHGPTGQFTRYLFRPPDGPESDIEVVAEVMVKENRGHAATIAVPFAGQLRIFPNHLLFVGSEIQRIPIEPGKYHTYRLRSGEGKLRLLVDDELKLETNKLDNRRLKNDWSPVVVSPLLFSFGNYPDPESYPPGSSANTSLVPSQITPAVTGLSLWKRVETTVTGVRGQVHRTSWTSAGNEFPDQYQLDHILEVEATVFGMDQGYSGWTELPDGRVFVVNYTDDGAPAWPASSRYLFRCPWIRGTFVLASDLKSR